MTASTDAPPSPLKALIAAGRGGLTIVREVYCSSKGGAAPAPAAAIGVFILADAAAAQSFYQDVVVPGIVTAAAAAATTAMAAGGQAADTPSDAARQVVIPAAGVARFFLRSAAQANVSADAAVALTRAVSATVTSFTSAVESSGAAVARTAWADLAAQPFDITLTFPLPDPSADPSSESGSAAAAAAKDDAEDDLSATVTTATRRILARLSPAQVQELVATFRKIDLSGDGAIDAAELTTAVRRTFSSASEDTIAAAVQAVLSHNDADGDARITFCEFVAGFRSATADPVASATTDPAIESASHAATLRAAATTLSDTARALLLELSEEQVVGLVEAFQRIDTNHDGALDIEELIAALRGTFDSVSAEDARDLALAVLDSSDRNQDGRIDFAEYVASFRAGVEAEEAGAVEAAESNAAGAAATASGDPDIEVAPAPAVARALNTGGTTPTSAIRLGGSGRRSSDAGAFQTPAAQFTGSSGNLGTLGAAGNTSLTSMRSATASSQLILSVLADPERDMLRDVFIRIDSDGDGFVTLEDLGAVCSQHLGPARYDRLWPYLRSMFVIADADADDRLSLLEFLSSYAEGPGIVPQEVLAATAAPIRTRLSEHEITALQAQFRRMDLDRDGRLDAAELSQALELEMPDRFTAEQRHEIAAAMIAAADRDGDGALNLSELLCSYQEEQGVLPPQLLLSAPTRLAQHLGAAMYDRVCEVAVFLARTQPASTLTAKEATDALLAAVAATVTASHKIAASEAAVLKRLVVGVIEAAQEKARADVEDDRIAALTAAAATSAIDAIGGGDITTAISIDEPEIQRSAAAAAALVAQTQESNFDDPPLSFELLHEVLLRGAPSTDTTEGQDALAGSDIRVSSHTAAATIDNGSLASGGTAPPPRLNVTAASAGGIADTVAPAAPYPMPPLLNMEPLQMAEFGGADAGETAAPSAAATPIGPTTTDAAPNRAHLDAEKLFAFLDRDHDGFIAPSDAMDAYVAVHGGGTLEVESPDNVSFTSGNTSRITSPRSARFGSHNGAGTLSSNNMNSSSPVINGGNGGGLGGIGTAADSTNMPPVTSTRSSLAPPPARGASTHGLGASTIVVLSPYAEAHMLRCFTAADLDGDGRLSRDEFALAVSLSTAPDLRLLPPEYVGRVSQRLVSTLPTPHLVRAVRNAFNSVSGIAYSSAAALSAAAISALSQALSGDLTTAQELLTLARSYAGAGFVRVPPQSSGDSSPSVDVATAQPTDAAEAMAAASVMLNPDFVRAIAADDDQLRCPLIVALGLTDRGRVLSNSSTRPGSPVPSTAVPRRVPTARPTSSTSSSATAAAISEAEAAAAAEAAQLAAVDRAFHRLDGNKSGYLERHEIDPLLMGRLRDQYADRWSMSAMRRAVDFLVCRADEDGDNKLCFQEWARAVRSRNPPMPFDVILKIANEAEAAAGSAGNSARGASSGAVAKRAVSSSDLAYISHLFASIDTKADGVLDAEELVASAGMRALLGDLKGEWALERWQTAVQELIQAADTDLDGALSKDEFVGAFSTGLCHMAKGSSLADSIAAGAHRLTPLETEQLRVAFTAIDTNQNGTISAEELTALLQENLAERFEADPESLRATVQAVFNAVRTSQRIHQIKQRKEQGAAGDASPTSVTTAGLARQDSFSFSQFVSAFETDPNILSAPLVAVRDRIARTETYLAELLEEEDLRRIAKVFVSLDVDKNGVLDFDELHDEMFSLLQSQHPDWEPEMVETALQRIFDAADINHDGQLSLEEFIASFASKHYVLPPGYVRSRAAQLTRRLTSEDMDELKSLFKSIDYNNDGRISTAELAELLREALADSMSDDVASVNAIIESVLAVVDTNNDGHLSFPEFVEAYERDTTVLDIPIMAAAARREIAERRMEMVLCEQDMRDLAKVFLFLDKNGDGFLSEDELRETLAQQLTRLHPDWTSTKVQETVKSLLLSADVNNDGRLSFDEFIESFVQGHYVLPESCVRDVAASCSKPLTDDQQLQLRAVFESLDKNGQGFVTREELTESLAAAIGRDHADAIGRAIMTVADKNGDGCLSLEEFVGCYRIDDGVFMIPVNQLSATTLTSMAEKLLPKDKLRDIGRVFHSIDTNHDGYIDVAELEVALLRWGLCATADGGHDVARAKIVAADMDGDGRLSLDEFLGSFATAGVASALVIPWEVVEQMTAAAASPAASPAGSPAPVAATTAPSGIATPSTPPSGAAVSVVPPAAAATAVSAPVVLTPSVVTAGPAVALFGPATQDEQEGSGAGRILPAEGSAAASLVKARKAAAAAAAAPAVDVATHASPSPSPARADDAVSESASAPRGTSGSMPAPHTTQGVSSRINPLERRKPAGTIAAPVDDAELRAEFAKFDKDGSGFLDAAEFRAVYRAMEDFGVPLSDRTIDGVMRKVILHRDGKEVVDFNGFCLAMLRRSKS